MNPSGKYFQIPIQTAATITLIQIIQRLRGAIRLRITVVVRHPQEAVVVAAAVAAEVDPAGHRDNRSCNKIPTDGITGL